MNIEIKGTIVKSDDKWIYDFLEIEATSPKDVLSKLREAKNEDVDVYINSGGGDLYAANEIYTALKEYPGNSTGKIVGIAGSAASVIAMGVKKLKIAPAAQIMIHKASVKTYGNHKEMDHASEVLKSHDEGIAKVYSLKTGMSEAKLLDLMDSETYLNAKKALKLKFVDEIMFEDDTELEIAASMAWEVPPNIVDKVKNLLIQSKMNEEPAEGSFFIAKNEDRAEETPQPVSNTKLDEQNSWLRNIKLKIFGGMINER